MIRTTPHKSKLGMLANRKALSGASLLVAALLLASSGRASAQSRPMEVVGPVETSLPDAPSAAPSAVSIPLVVSFGTLDFDGYLPRTPPSRGFLSVVSTAKFLEFEDHVASPDALANVLVGAIQAQFGHSWPGYGHGLSGFEKRVGAVMLDRDASSFFGTFLFPSLFHEDMHYHRLGPEASVWHRAAYAMSRTLFTRNDAGGTSFNSALLLSVVASQSLKNLYYPSAQRGWAATWQRSRDALLGSMQDNLMREFLPDIERFLWRHMPGGLKRLEKRIPMRSVWEPEAFAESEAEF